MFLRPRHCRIGAASAVNGLWSSEQAGPTTHFAEGGEEVLPTSVSILVQRLSRWYRSTARFAASPREIPGDRIISALMSRSILRSSLRQMRRSCFSASRDLRPLSRGHTQTPRRMIARIAIAVRLSMLRYAPDSGMSCSRDRRCPFRQRCQSDRRCLCREAGRRAPSLPWSLVRDPQSRIMAYSYPTFN